MVSVKIIIAISKRIVIMILKKIVMAVLEKIISGIVILVTVLGMKFVALEIIWRAFYLIEKF
ncbi:hypothetical protein [Brachyspira sp.]|uniref:hypothetical protein n=1 Tax=Brachyspira sp. TaxID=1977261 RepID=UPI003D7D0187